MTKRIFACFAAVFILYSVSASGKLDTPKKQMPQTVRIGVLAGPSGLGLAKLISSPPVLADTTVCAFEVVGSVDALLPKLVNGDLDVGILPPNVAAKLYNLNPSSLVAAAVVGNGMISLVTRDPAIKTLSDLEGKSVSVAGQGATPEYVMRTLMDSAGMPAEAVSLDFSIPTPNIAAALVSDKIEYALLPEPFATVAVMNGKNGDAPVQKALSIRTIWEASGLGNDFPMTLCVADAGFAREYPELTRAFLDAYQGSIEWTVQNPAEAGPLAEAVGLGLKAAIASKAIPSCNFVFNTAEEGKPEIEALLSTFLKYAPAAIGGKLPDDGFYFK